MSEKQEQSLQEYTSRVIRGPKTTVYQQLLAGQLIKANRQKTPLEKISILCEAAFMCREKEGLDMETVEGVYCVAISLKSTEVRKDGSTKIAWIFPENQENYARYIKPWHRIRLSYYPLETAYCHKEHPRRPSFYPTTPGEEERLYDMWEEIREEVHEAMREMPEHESFLQRCTAISRDSFFSLRGEFEAWALSRMLPIEATILEQVDPDVYKETLSILMAGQEDEEE